MKTATRPITFPQQNAHSPEEIWHQAWKYAYTLTRSSHDAEDLVQQAWLKVTSRYNEVANKSILKTTIRNLFIDGKRREKIVRFEELDEVNPGKSKEKLRTASKDVEIIFEILTDNERRCLYMNFVEGYTAEEIASQTGIPRGTVLSHNYRAKKKLQEKFGHEFSNAFSQQSLSA